MSKSTTGPAGSASRRAILLNSASIAGGLILCAPVAHTASAQTKLTHEVAKYQDTPKDDQKCSTCIQFVTPPASCKIVVDPISPDGWCQFYGAKPG